MKKKGFTLIELLAVAVILGLMVLMVVPNLISTFNATKEKNKELFLEQLTEAAKVYAQNHKNDIEELRKEGGVIYITLEDLINEDLVTAPVIDPSNNKEVSPKTLLKIVRAANNLFEIEYNVIAPPILTISGVNPLDLIVGETYGELGAKAVSPIDGDLTGSIRIDGSVNTSVEGTYTITYTVTDSLGVTVSKKRTVRVKKDDSLYSSTKGVNKPLLATGMTPIKWNGSA
ncbi:MAG: immunoglobulin-like domain-containing protein, partial [Bacilli bacterium]